jgi:4'-phosphopantetheinyl transferase
MPGAELHLWHAQLDGDGWPPVDELPAVERERAESLLRPLARRRWVASRWALRGVLGRYLDAKPAEVGLRLRERGKPALPDPAHPLRFNLSHSGELALIAVVEELEVGIDVEGLGSRPAEFYAEWTRREAIAKCHGSGLWAPLPDEPVACSSFDPGVAFAAAVAVAGERVPPLRHFVAEAPAGA